MQQEQALVRPRASPGADVALAADHLASGRIMMFASVVIFPRTAFFFFDASTLCFHGIDVRPVMPSATCYTASANDGAPCKRLGRVCK